jgi:hypothetical protein
MVHVAAQRDGPAGATLDGQLSVDLHLRTDAIWISIANLGETPIDVLWGKASLVDTAGNVYGVVHSAAEGSPAPDPPGHSSRIAPKATLDAFVIPTRCVRFDARYGWVVEPLLPVECGPIRCVGYHELVGKTIRVSLPMQVSGTERAFDWSFLITNAVRSSRGTRPEDPALH